MRNASFYFVQNHSNSECIVVNLQVSSFSVKHTDEKLLRFTDKTFIKNFYISTIQRYSRVSNNNVKIYNIIWEFQMITTKNVKSSNNIQIIIHILAGERECILGVSGSHSNAR